MYESFISSFKVEFAQNANTLIYYLKRIPILGKRIPSKLYAETDGKIIYGLIKLILNFIGEFIRKFVYILLFIILPCKYISEGVDTLSYEDLIVTTFCILNIIYGSYGNSKIFFQNEKMYIMIRYLRTNPKKYILGQLVYKVISEFVYFLPSIIIADFGIKNSIILLVELSMFRVFGEILNIILYEKFNFILGEHNIVYFILGLSVIAVTYGLPFMNIVIDFKKVVYNPIFMAIAVLCGVYLAIKLYKYNGYTKISRRMFRANLLLNDEIEKYSQFSDVEINDKKSNKKLLNTKKYNNKSGYEYLNSIFFHRNNRVVRKAILIRCIIIVLVSIVLIIGSFTFMKGKNEESFNMLINSCNYFVFILYLMSSTERLCKSMFYNCDVALLNYNFYKTPKGILDNFKSRLKKIILYNSIPVAFLILGITAYIFSIDKQTEFIRVIPLFISIITLSSFFSIYGLFMYYIMQPYTKDLEVKSFFTISNEILGVVLYICLKLDIQSIYFTLIVIIVTLIFTPTALYSIYKFAPKTFRLK